jgi:hypothetical protein
MPPIAIGGMAWLALADPSAIILFATSSASSDRPKQNRRGIAR